MSTTPGSKLSPFGNSIRKTLLTPCRRVGLSRKTKTPNSLNKLFSQTPSSNTKLSDQQSIVTPGGNAKLSEQQSNITPVNKKTSIKRKSLVELDKPTEKSSKLEDNVKSKSNAKKSLNNCFINKEDELKSNSNIPTDDSNAKEIISKNNAKNCKKRHEHENIDKEAKTNSKIKGIKKIEDSCKKVITTEHDFKSEIEQSATSADVIETIAQVHTDYTKNGILADHDYTKNNFPNADTEISEFKELCKENISNKKMIRCFELEGNNSATSTSSSPIVRKPRKNRILSDSDDDFTDLPTENPKHKNESSEESILMERKPSFNNKFVDRIKDCEIGLPTLSEENIEIIKNKCAKKKKAFILSDDDDDDFCPESSTKLKKSLLEMKFKTKSSSNSSMVKIDTGQNIPEDKKSTEKKSKKSSKTIISKLTSLDDEDEGAFTSTPDREENEKRELIDKIKDLESKIKIKKQKVENLTRASLYKSKHNIDELKQLSETWKQGCILGLNELLLKLQSHGPIDMSTLLRNLRIPDEMVARLFVNVN